MSFGKGILILGISASLVVVALGYSRYFAVHTTTIENVVTSQHWPGMRLKISGYQSVGSEDKSYYLADGQGRSGFYLKIRFVGNATPVSAEPSNPDPHIVITGTLHLADGFWFIDVKYVDVVSSASAPVGGRSAISLKMLTQ